MNKYKQKKGFSLPEVIIAISIIVLIIVSATNLLVSSMRANRGNINQIVAYNLAQEAIEGLRNIRDGYWLHNKYWRGDELVEKGIFGESFHLDGYYIIEKNNNLFTQEQCSLPSNELNRIETVSQYAPWKLTNIGSQTNEMSKLYIGIRNASDEIKQYSHEPIGDESGFRRWLEIQTIPYEYVSSEQQDELKIAVTAVVEWEEGGRTRDIRIPTVLSDWKEGPL